jgi:hypothetical protein
MRPTFIALLLAGTATACGSGMSIHTDYDPLEMPRFGTWKSYIWLAHPGGQDTRAYGKRVAPLVPSAVDAALAGKGYQRVEANPDFRIGWHAGVGDRLDVNEINSYYGYNWGRWFPGGGVAYSSGYISEYAEGTLIIDVVDVKSNDLVWRGRSGTALKKLKTDADLQKAVAQAVTRILAEFPPHGKAKAPTKAPGKTPAPAPPMPRTRPPG